MAETKATARTILYLDLTEGESALLAWSPDQPEEPARPLRFGLDMAPRHATIDRTGKTLMGWGRVREGGFAILSINLAKPHFAPAKLMLLPDHLPAWPRQSPDGARLAYLAVPPERPLRINVRADLMLCAKSGHDWTQEQPPRPALFAAFDWGPDSQEILYRDPERGLVLARAAAGTPPQTIDGHARLPLTSPSGNIGAFYARREIMLVGAQGRTVIRLDHALSALAWDCDDQGLLLALGTGFNQSTIARLAVVGGKPQGSPQPLFTAGPVSFLAATSCIV